ncbi:MAG: hypothetical protein ABSD29_12270 [Verrucomicrobiota bacterium]|jgi:hypothetical protein
MKTCIKSLTAGILAGLAVLALCATARADLTIVNSTTITSWNTVNGQNPFYVSIPSARLSGATTGQGQPSAASGASNTVLSETFTITNGAGSLTIPNTNYVLTAIAILGITQPNNSSIHLYDVTATLTSSSGTPLLGVGATYDFVSNGDLLGNGNGLSLSNTLAGTDQVLYNLSEGPHTLDQVVLGANHTYAVEIWTPTGSGFNWQRNGGSPVDPGGEALASHDASLTVPRVTLNQCGGLAGGAPRFFALALYGSPTSAAPSINTNLVTVPVTTYVIDAFNSFGYGPTNRYVGANDYNLGQITNVWEAWPGFGSAFSSLVWDSTSDAYNNPSSGSLKILATFPGQYAVIDGFNGISPPLSAYTNGLTSFQCDVRFDPSSATTVNSSSGVTNYGHLQFGMQLNGSSQDWFGSLEVSAGTTNWVHVNLPISINTDANLLAINDVVIKIDGGWYGSNPLNGASTLWVDNIEFTAPTNYVMPAPPTLAIQKATPALRMFAGSTVNTYDRVELATADQSQSWIGGTYPVSYSFTLLDYPASINQTHIFLVPVNSVSGGSSSMYNNEYVEYQATNALWLDIQPYGTGGATASVLWKTNLPNSNPDQTALVITNSTTAVGTWTLTFTNSGAGTVTAPGGNSGSFTIADPNVATDFQNPLVAYFGLQPNSGAGEGEYEDWASISVTGVTGANENDNFTTDSSLNTGLWSINTLTVALNSCVQLVTTNTPYWVNWTLPAVDCGLGTVSALENTNTLPWMLPEYYNYYGDGNTIPNTANQGNKTWVLIPSTCLPTVDGSQGGVPSPKAFFRLFQGPLQY